MTAENHEHSEECAPTQCATCTSTTCPSKQANSGPKHEPETPTDEKLKSRLSRIKKKIIVMSGKGGVGKSTVAVNIAIAAAMSGRKVGLLDVDLHGPSVPTMMGLEGHRLTGDDSGMDPIEKNGVRVISVGFLLENADSPVVWRGPLKMGVIRQFIEEVNWGDLDLLVVDVPPGTGDEPLSICQNISDLDGAVIVTTPQKVAAVDVRKSITFCKDVGVHVIGIVENMSGFVCPKCGELTQILSGSAGQSMATDMHVPFLGAIPIDPMISQCGDAGEAFVQLKDTSPVARTFRDIVTAVIMQ